MTVETRKSKISTVKVYPLNYGEWTYYEVQGKEEDKHKYHVHIPVKPLKGEYFGQVYYEYRPTCRTKVDGSICKGNSNGTVCYHVLAAIKHRVAQRDKTLSLPKNGERPNAQKLLNLGGQLVRIVNQNGKVAWGVVR